MRRHIASLVIALAAAAGCTDGSSSSSSSSGPKKASTPRAAVEGMIAAAEKRDVAVMAGYIAEPAGSKVKATGDGAMAVQKATGKLVQAVDAKFGAGTAASIRIKAQEMPEPGKVEIVKVEEKGDTATAVTRETRKDGSTKEDTLALKKIDGAWYLDPAKDDDSFGEEALKMADTMGPALTKMAGEIEALAKDVDGGKVATKEDVQKKYGEIQMGMMKAMMSAQEPPK